MIVQTKIINPTDSKQHYSWVPKYGLYIAAKDEVIIDGDIYTLSASVVKDRKCIDEDIRTKRVEIIMLTDLQVESIEEAVKPAPKVVKPKPAPKPPVPMSRNIKEDEELPPDEEPTRVTAPKGTFSEIQNEELPRIPAEPIRDADLSIAPTPMPKEKKSDRSIVDEVFDIANIQSDDIPKDIPIEVEVYKEPDFIDRDEEINILGKGLVDGSIEDNKSQALDPFTGEVLKNDLPKAESVSDFLWGGDDEDVVDESTSSSTEEESSPCAE